MTSRSLEEQQRPLRDLGIPTFLWAFKASSLLGLGQIAANTGNKFEHPSFQFIGAFQQLKNSIHSF